MPSINTMFGSGPTAPHSEYSQTPTVPATGDSSVGGSLSFIDGTPMRVATILILAALGLASLRWAGYRFNVTSG